MAIFNSYVKLPEGTCKILPKQFQKKQVNYTLYLFLGCYTAISDAKVSKPIAKLHVRMKIAGCHGSLITHMASIDIHCGLNHRILTHLHNPFSSQHGCKTLSSDPRIYTLHMICIYIYMYIYICAYTYISYIHICLYIVIHREREIDSCPAITCSLQLRDCSPPQHHQHLRTCTCHEPTWQHPERRFRVWRYGVIL